jgi:hypothetical protein
MLIRCPNKSNRAKPIWEAREIDSFLIQQQELQQDLDRVSRVALRFGAKRI